MDAREFEVLAERQYLDATGRSVVVKLGKPRPGPRPGGDWGCPFTVLIGSQQAPVRDVYGVDTLQAVLLCLRVVKAELARLDRTIGPLSFEGEQGLWLEWLDSPSPRARGEGAGG